MTGEIHRRLHADKGYKLKELLTVRTIRNKLAELEIGPLWVKKYKPIGRVPETDAIFDKVHSVNAATDKNP